MLPNVAFAEGFPAFSGVVGLDNVDGIGWNNAKCIAFANATKEKPNYCGTDCQNYEDSKGKEEFLFLAHDGGVKKFSQNYILICNTMYFRVRFFRD